MEILSIKQEEAKLKVTFEEIDDVINNLIYLSFNNLETEKKITDNEIVIDLEDYTFVQGEKNILSFEYRVKLDEEELKEATHSLNYKVHSLSLKKYNEKEAPAFKVLERSTEELIEDNEGKRIEEKTVYIKPYITKKKNLRVHYGTSTPFSGKQYLSKVKAKKDCTELTLTVTTGRYKVSNVELVLLARENLNEIRINNSNFSRISNATLYFKYKMIIYIDWKKYELLDDIYDVYIEITYECAKDVEKLKKRLRVGKTRYLRRKFIKSQYFTQRDTVLGVNPYFTHQHNNLSFNVQNIPTETYNVFKKGNIKQSDVIIIGERPYKAQDTGFALFKQLRLNYPNLPVYYVIQYDSPEYENVKPYGNTVDFGTAEHARLMLQAKVIYCSHHFYYLYPFRDDRFEKKIKAKRIFIQHGVLGVKNLSSLYGRSVKKFNPDLFVVSSDYEKEVTVRNLNYNPNEVVVTGLSRFDTLFDGKSQLKNQILVIPTWREWLAGKDKFLCSKYFEYYHSLINDEELNAKLNETNTKLVFCLHPNMQKFTAYFESKFDNVQIISQGEVNVQDLIKESKMMITDYSSVAFDFAFLDKPVIYFQFDRNRYLGKFGSFLNLDKDLPGIIVFNYEGLIEQSVEVIASDYIVSAELKARAKKFLKYKDLNNSKRILELINYDLKAPKLERLYKQNEFTGRLYKLIRKSKFYFPIMKKIYLLLKLLPMKDNYIVFESGVGRQLADAPREIYDRLVATDNGKYKKIWAYNGKKQLTDSNTKVVKRLSPMYYYYLATSKYWVNNQNFPYYITTRKNTKYLQTWHGTPLKKMLFDLDKVVGRNEGYVDRVSQATKQWTTLLAQSDYAEEKFRSAFRFKKEVLKLGYPRNDVLFRDTSDAESQLRAMLNIDSDKKIILYAPTFRDDAVKKGNKFEVELQIDFDNFINQLSDDYILLLRFHVITSNRVKIPKEYRHRIKNVSKYPEIQDLYKISDCLITDYSSAFFDYANLRRPMIFYAYDLEEYEYDLRGFYVDYKEIVPGPIVYEEMELYKQLSNLDGVRDKYSNKIEEVLDKFAPYDDANSTQRVIDYFFEE